MGEGSAGLTRARLTLAALAALALAGPATAQEEEGNVFTNLFRYGGTTVPPAAAQQIDAAYCPMVDIIDGGASIQARAGESLRSQVTVGAIARECAPLADGSVTVKVGVEVRALLGPSGAAGRFEAPVRILIKRNEQVVTSRARRIAVTIPSGSSQASATVVEDGIVVPVRFARDYEIEVGLGGGTPPRAAPRRARAPSPG